MPFAGFTTRPKLNEPSSDSADSSGLIDEAPVTSIESQADANANEEAEREDDADAEPKHDDKPCVLHQRAKIDYAIP